MNTTQNDRPSADVVYAEMFAELRRYRDFEQSTASWASTVLLALAAGGVALFTGDPVSDAPKLTEFQRLWFLLAVAAVTLLADLTILYAGRRYRQLKRVAEDKYGAWKEGLPSVMNPLTYQIVLVTIIGILAMAVVGNIPTRGEFPVGLSASWEIALGVVGVLAAVGGWILDHLGTLPSVSRVVAPKFHRAVAAYERAIASGDRLEQGASGFREIASILSTKLSGSGDLTIQSLGFSEPAQSAKSRDTELIWVPTITATIVFGDGRSVTKSGVPDLREQIREQYFDRRVFRLASVLFWSGVALEVLAIALLST